ncbi:MAG: hypothetical protein AB1798_13885, partial [Spirochaetota bacterium]
TQNIQNVTSYPICPVCGKPVKDLYNAIADKVKGEPVHFDCIVKTITDNENLAPNETVSYLGKGSFGIIKNKGGSGPNQFTIRKRIQYEDTSQVFEWRKKISTRFKNI